MNFLITGIAGFVGSSLARVLLDLYPNIAITGIDNLSYGYVDRISDIRSRINFIEGDVIDIAEYLGQKHFDAIIHCAAIAPLPECQINGYRALQQNVSVCGSIIDYALGTGSKNIVFFSSGAIYEGIDKFPTDENVEIKTSLIYPSTKYLAELFFEAMCRSHAINVTAIRLFNLYGPRQDYFRKQPPLVGYLLSCLILKKTATLFSNGEQQRDYVFIDDLLDLVILSIERMQSLKKDGNFLAVNAGTGVSISVNQIIKILEKISGESLHIERKPASQYWDKYDELFSKKIPLNKEIVDAEVNKHTNASINLATKDLKWSPKISLENGLGKCYSFAKTILGVQS